MHCVTADTHVVLRRPAVFIARPATGGRTLVRLRLPSVVRPVAAGATWKLVIDSAPWAARYLHTTVVDASGAIYVICGRSGTFTVSTVYNDVWVSTDGGLDRASGVLATRGLRSGYRRGTQGGTPGVLWYSTLAYFGVI